jgi:response regulator RpfG family c-di-GMP phosphodiesterase
MTHLATTNGRVLTFFKELLGGFRTGSARSAGRPVTTNPDNMSRPTPRVLCIDDDLDYVQALRRRLESRGIVVLRATSGLDGFCSAVGETIDAILLDYQLPNGCGDYILEQLKVNPTTKDIPVIVISGCKDRVLEHTLINGGAARFMHKPLDFEELMTELGKYLPVKLCGRCPF